MEKLVVIDGNFWLFSCYYATAAMGNLMVNKDGVPTNAVYGFANRLESLIDAGTFDEFGLNRATLKANLEKITEYAHLKNMIGIDEPPILEIIKENKMVRLELEKKALGVYLTQHPLAYMKQKINQPILAVANLNEYVSKNVRVLLSLLRVKVIVDKKGNEMCFIEGFDETGNVEGVVFY